MPIAGQVDTVNIPSPSKWGIHAEIAGRPIVWGELVLRVHADQQISGTINFRGVPIPIHGLWNERFQQITFDSPYATYLGNMSVYDDVPIQTRHLILKGNLRMKPPSLQTGERGTWIATTDIGLTGTPSKISSGQRSPPLPPVGVFLSSNILNQLRK